MFWVQYASGQITKQTIKKKIKLSVSAEIHRCCSAVVLIDERTDSVYKSMDVLSVCPAPAETRLGLSLHALQTQKGQRALEVSEDWRLEP